MAVPFVLVTTALLVTTGMGLDFARSYKAQQRMQADLDAAVLAAVRDISTSDKPALQKIVTDWFAAQTDQSAYTIDDIGIDLTNDTIKATVRGSVPTSLMQLASVKTMPIAATSSVTGPRSSYLDVYIVLDNSASMMLAATSAGQTQMTNAIGCAFACHTVGDNADKLKAKGGYKNNYEYARGNGIQLRTDVALDAARSVLDSIKQSDPQGKYTRVGIYRIGATAVEAVKPTTNTATAAAALTEATAENFSYFDQSLPKMASFVGKAGDGSSLDNSRKLVLLLTDGVRSDINFPSTTNLVVPLNPAWCKTISKDGAAVGVLYTRYLPINDTRYTNTLGKTMASSSWTSLFGGVYRSGTKPSISRADYLPNALQDCASSTSLFISADSGDAIKAGLVSLLQRYMSQVRLTQ
ncbi:membrane protein [Aureimonas endophytica]|uniref:Membrane protein n=1 Tax=Aureimonas endophytica TaxID=2027858 RepID=A0A916ZRH2_9HYPH|nr:membrane protein [Aureimonas endophytica]